MLLHGGDVIAERYRILKPLGQGGMSEVYLAIDLHLGRQWAIKLVPHEGGQSDPSAHLLREARLLRRLTHPAFPRIVDIISWGDPPQFLLIIMDYIEGRTLARVLGEEGALSEARVRDLAAKASEILRYLHGLDPPLVYRDLKPANLILRPDGSLCIIDFGIACRAGSREEALGTPGFAPPEQCRGAPSDIRMDFYALGVTLICALLGSSSPPGDPKNALLSSRCSAGFAAIIARLTETDPTLRYQDADTLLRALEDPARALRKQARARMLKLTFFLLSILSSLTLFLAAVFFRAIAEYTNEAQYQALLAPSYLRDEIARRNDLVEAALLRPDDARAVLALLSLLEEGEVFDETADEQLSSALLSCDAVRSKQSEQSAEILCRCGMLYLYRYGGAECSLRTRALRALPFFEDAGICDSADEKWQQSAERLADICRFIAGAGQPESTLTSAQCETLLHSLDHIIENNPDLSDGLFLDFCRTAADLLHAECTVFVSLKFPAETILSRYRTLLTLTTELAPSSRALISKQEALLFDLRSYLAEDAKLPWTSNSQNSPISSSH